VSFQHLAHFREYLPIHLFSGNVALKAIVVNNVEGFLANL
jgi:hypothetical protein